MSKQYGLAGVRQELNIARKELKRLYHNVCEIIGLDPEETNIVAVRKRLTELRDAAGWDPSYPRGGPNPDFADHALESLGYKTLWEMCHLKPKAKSTTHRIPPRGVGSSD